MQSKFHMLHKAAHCTDYSIQHSILLTFPLPRCQERDVARRVIPCTCPLKLLVEFSVRRFDHLPFIHWNSISYSLPDCFKESGASFFSSDNPSSSLLLLSDNFSLSLTSKLCRRTKGWHLFFHTFYSCNTMNTETIIYFFWEIQQVVHVIIRLQLQKAHVRASGRHTFISTTILRFLVFLPPQTLCPQVQKSPRLLPAPIMLLGLLILRAHHVVTVSQHRGSWVMGRSGRVPAGLMPIQNASGWINQSLVLEAVSDYTPLLLGRDSQGIELGACGTRQAFKRGTPTEP